MYFAFWLSLYFFVYIETEYRVVTHFFQGRNNHDLIVFFCLFVEDDLENNDDDEPWKAKMSPPPLIWRLPTLLSLCR